MKHLKTYENSIVDNILDKISSNGIESLTPMEREYLNKFSKNEPTTDVQKEMSKKSYEDFLTQGLSAKLELYNVETNEEGEKYYNAKLDINDNLYDCVMFFNEDGYLETSFEGETPYSDYEGLEHEIDGFLENAYYEMIEK